jgi:uncharacterized phage protein (TIGR01671 family)
MREIKFRAWDGYAKKMVGDFRGAAEVYDDGKMREIHPATVVMQFTGLRDKNGKEIYEGDIVEFTDKWEWYRGSYGIKMMFASKEERTSLVAQYEAEPMHRFAVEFSPHEGYNLSRGDMQVYAVIGNIYENPELCATKSNSNSTV